MHSYVASAPASREPKSSRSGDLAGRHRHGSLCNFAANMPRGGTFASLQVAVQRALLSSEDVALHLPICSREAAPSLALRNLLCDIAAGSVRVVLCDIAASVREFLRVGVTGGLAASSGIHGCS